MRKMEKAKKVMKGKTNNSIGHRRQKQNTDLFQKVKAAVSTRQAAEHYGIKVSRSGMACCPFHDDRTPSMKVDRNFICFGCQEKGDVIRFTARLFDLTPKEAAIKLIRDFGLDISVQKSEIVQTATLKRPGSDRARMKLLEQYTDRMYLVYCDYLHLLNDWKFRYAPRSPDEDWHPLFIEACHKTDYVEYLLDCLFDGTPADRAMIIIEKKKEAETLEKRIREFKSGESYGTGPDIGAAAGAGPD